MAKTKTKTVKQKTPKVNKAKTPKTPKVNKAKTPKTPKVNKAKAPRAQYGKKFTKTGGFKALVACIAIVVIGGGVVGGLWLGGVFDKGRVPIYDASNRYTVQAVENNYRVDYSYTDGAFNYYYIYLGKVDFVPISAEGTKYYNGTTPISLSYTSSTVTEQHIEEENAFCITSTTQTQISQKHEASVKSTTEVGGNIFGAEVKESIELGYTYTSETQRQKGYSNSTTKTYKSFQSWQQTNSETISYTIGEHGEKAGFYRYALFTTSDIYVVIAEDKMDGTYYYEYSGFARANTFFTAIDFNATNDFTTRESAAKLEFNSDIIDNLEQPVNNNTDTVVLYDYSARTNLNIGQVSVPAGVEQVIFIGNASRTFTMNIVIAPRNNLLKIVLNNMKFTAPLGKNGIDDTGALSGKHTVYIALYGDNAVTGGAGADGKDDIVPYIRDYDAAQDLREAVELHAKYNDILGKDGCDGIALDKNDLYVSGKGKLAVTGGKGGKSGVISLIRWTGSTGLHIIQNHGFTGGAGGRGIACNSVSFAGALGENITIKGGAGADGPDSAVFTNGNPLRPENRNPLYDGNGADGGDALALIATGEDKITQPESRPVNLTGGSGGAAGGGYKGNNGRTGL